MENGTLLATIYTKLESHAEIASKYKAAAFLEPPNGSVD